ncbi:uncharacterized protein LOC131604212 [Vicia villosa]|uniref:uncharacterized protein LOC131604212 n=1 Tax=Vicia villosa TaxID=3911 RepID=UPI00273A9533|nr:uncharacterized protein LOC131604212 [Vicia villosa]
MADEFEWCANISGIFSVASVSAMVSNLKSCAWQPQIVSVMKILWNMLIPLKIQIFAWRLFTSRLPTKDLSLLRGVVNISNPFCEFCGNHPETLSHIFFFCQVSKKVWEWIFLWLGEELPFSIEEFKDFDVLQEKIKIANARVKINTIWMTTIWSIWIMRNSIIFEQVLYSFDMVFYNVM